MRYVVLLFKVLLVVGGTAACAWMARRWGAWPALAIWAAATGLLCGVIGLIVSGQEPGKVTAANYLMGLILQWGYRVAKGHLPGIVTVSWAIWMLAGVAGIVAASLLAVPTPSSLTPGVEAEAGGRSAAVMSLLAVAWLVDGALLLWLIGLTVKRSEGNGQVRALAPIMGILLLMIVGSVALVVLSPTASAAWTALLVAGGPVLLVGVGYGLFVVLIVTVGRNARWN